MAVKRLLGVGWGAIVLLFRSLTKKTEYETKEQSILTPPLVSVLLQPFKLSNELATFCDQNWNLIGFRATRCDLKEVTSNNISLQRKTQDMTAVDAYHVEESLFIRS